MTRPDVPTQRVGVYPGSFNPPTTAHLAIAEAELDAAVVFYGSLPGVGEDGIGDKVAAIAAPVLGLYGGDDARINATLPATITAMMDQGKSYELHTFEGAGRIP